MTNTPKDPETLRDLLAEHARRDADTQEPAPEPEELLDFLEDRLPPDEARRLERRVLADPDAATALADLADFAEAEKTAGSSVPEVATHAGWRDFERRLETAGTAEAASTPKNRPPPWLSAVAAALLVAVLGLGAWVWTLRSAEPLWVANPESLTLVAARGEEAVVSLTDGAPLRLVLSPTERCPTYRASIERSGPGGETSSRSLAGLVRDERGLVTLLVPGESGAYSLTLSGCDPPRDLETHRFRIVPESDGG